MHQVIPIQTLHLFAVLDDLLITLLNSLSPDEWNKPTLARLWTVKDIAAHLLDGNVRGIAASQGYEPPISKAIHSYQDLIDFLNELNAGWVKAMKRVSPALLTEQLATTGKQYIEYLRTLDPFAPAKYAVAWAGEEQSYNWFHIAREYTEKWHHQQQIREAVGRTAPLMAPELFDPCMATFMCALPHAYRNVDASTGVVIRFMIGSNQWFLEKLETNWAFTQNKDANATITLQPKTAWKLFTKAITPQAAAADIVIEGDTYLAKGILNMVAVMA